MLNTNPKRDSLQDLFIIKEDSNLVTGMQNYLLVSECNGLCSSDTVGQQSWESKHETKDVHTHQSDDLFVVMIN